MDRQQHEGTETDNNKKQEGLETDNKGTEQVFPPLFEIGVPQNTDLQSLPEEKSLHRTLQTMSFPGLT